VLFSAPGGGEIRLDTPSAMSGNRGAPGFGARFFYAEFSKPVSGSNMVSGR
jgi:hypothetical protein